MKKPFLKNKNAWLIFLFFLLQDCLKSCQDQIEQTLSSNLSHMAQLSESAPPKVEIHANHRVQHEGQPTTPTDVQDIVF